MNTNVDIYGRVQLPAALMERLKLLPGSELACSFRDGGIFMVPLVQSAGKDVSPPAKSGRSSRCFALAAFASGHRAGKCA